MALAGAAPGLDAGRAVAAEVSSYAIDDGARLLLFDPLSVPDELLELTADREPVVVLTAPWHERDTQSLVGRLGVPVFVPPPDTADDLVQNYGITAEQAGGGSPDVAWLLTGDGGEAHLYAAGDRLTRLRPFETADADPREGVQGHWGHRICHRRVWAEHDIASTDELPAPCAKRP